MKATINEATGQPAGVLFRDMKTGELGIILPGTNHAGVAVLKTMHAVVSLDGPYPLDQWSSFSTCTHRVRLLPPGSTVTLTQE